MVNTEADPLLEGLSRLAANYCNDLREAESSGPRPGVNEPIADDPVLAQAMRISMVQLHRYPDYKTTVKAFEADATLAALHPEPGRLDPMIIQAGGAIRVNSEMVLRAVIASAARKMYFFGLPWDAAMMQSLVAEGLQQLRRAVCGELVRSYEVVGFDGVTLPPGAEVATPWGKLRATPKAQSTTLPSLFSRRATIVLMTPVDSVITIDRSAEPAISPEAERLASARGRARLLFPLACCLATEGDRRVPPLEVWQTRLSPYATGFAYGQPYVLSTPRIQAIELTLPEMDQLRQWSGLVNDRHHESLDVAARRVVSALAQRMDIHDRLIDAVIAWENLFGARPETSFRLCAAITKLLEPSINKRPQYLAKMLKIYGVRSSVAHGSTGDAMGVTSAAAEAIDVAINCLRLLYTDHVDLVKLKPSARANALLLG